MAKLYVTHGFIGFGKTTFARNFSIQNNAFYVNNDDWMLKLYGSNPNASKFDEYWDNINDIQMELIEKLLNYGVDVIFDNGMWQKSEREEIRQFAQTHDADCIFYKIECDIPTAKQRVSKRNESNAIFISQETFDEKFQYFQPMDSTENFILIPQNFNITQ